MSASTSNTLAPPYASATARLHAVVVLPSSGCALVTIRTPVPGAEWLNATEVRSDRMDSPNWPERPADSNG